MSDDPPKFTAEQVLSLLGDPTIQIPAPEEATSRLRARYSDEVGDASIGALDVDRFVARPTSGDTPPLVCTLRQGHRGDHWHDPAQDTRGSCGLPAGPRLRLVRP